MLLFTSVMHGQHIEVHSIDKDAGVLIVQNCFQNERSQGWNCLERNHQSPQPVLFLLNLDLHARHVREGLLPIEMNDHNGSLDHILHFVDSAKIAMTPREHFLEVTHRKTSPKPFSLSQYKCGNMPLTDYEQAAHNARQMGSLLHVPSTIGY